MRDINPIPFYNYFRRSKPAHKKTQRISNKFTNLDELYYYLDEWYYDGIGLQNEQLS